MANPTRSRKKPTERELAAEAEARRGDVSGLKRVAMNTEPSITSSALFSVRLPAAELERWREAAQASGVSVSDFVRGAVGAQLMERALKVSVGRTTVVVSSGLRAALMGSTGSATLKEPEGASASAAAATAA